MLQLLYKIQKMRKAQVLAAKFPNNLNKFKALKLEVEVDKEVYNEILIGLAQQFPAKKLDAYEKYQQWEKKGCPGHEQWKKDLEQSFHDFYDNSPLGGPEKPQH